MGQVTGSFGRVVVDKEASFGQLNATTKAGWIIPFATAGVSKEQNLLEDDTITSTRDPQEPGLGQVNVNGDLNIRLNPLSHGRLLVFTLGGYTAPAALTDPDGVAGSGDEYYDHIITVGSAIPSFFIEQRFSDGQNFTRYSWYKGCKINQWSFSLRTESFIENTFSIIGASKEVSTTEYDAAAVDNGHVGFTNYNAVVEMDNAQVGILTELSFTYNNNLDENTFTVSGGATRTSLPEGRVSVSGSATMQFTDTAVTYMDLAENATKTSIRIKLSRGAGNGTAGNEYLEIYMPEVRLQPPREEISGPQGIFLTFNFYAFDSDGDSTVRINIKNQIADYDPPVA